MSPLTPEEADQLLATATRIPVAKASLTDGRAFVETLLAAGIPATVHRPEDCCGGGGCGPSFEVLVRQEDVPHIQALQRGRWEAALEREGLTPVEVRHTEAGHDEPPCPACGLAAPLLNGACSDCGLQLE